MAVWCNVVVLFVVMEHVSGVDLSLIKVRKIGSLWIVPSMVKVDVPKVCSRLWLFSFVVPGDMVMVVLGGDDWERRDARRMNQYWSF